MKKKIKDWFVCILFALLFVMMIYGVAMVFAYFPTLSDAFHNAVGGIDNFRGNPEATSKFIIPRLICIFAILIIIFRFIMWRIDSNEKED